MAGPLVMAKPGQTSSLVSVQCLVQPVHWKTQIVKHKDTLTGEHKIIGWNKSGTVTNGAQQSTTQLSSPSMTPMTTGAVSAASLTQVMISAWIERPRLDSFLSISFKALFMTDYEGPNHQSTTVTLSIVTFFQDVFNTISTLFSILNSQITIIK